MSLSKERRIEIECCIINAIGQQNKTSITQKAIADKFDISVQSVSRIIRKMEQSGRILKHRDGRKNAYTLPTKIEVYKYQLNGLTEDKVHRDIIVDFFHSAPKCAYDNLIYAFSEILNNAIEHSNGTEVEITLIRDESKLLFSIADNGVGIFSKIADALKLDEKRFAILELAKGKFTTDPDSHSGEGIFFSSKCGDLFIIKSDGIEFVTDPNIEMLYESLKPAIHTGTKVIFMVSTANKKTLRELFDQYTDVPESYGFSKTIIPIQLLEYGDKAPVFISRSQARRLIARIERFKVVLLDFSGIDFIGQGFADEIFRVFKTRHPEVNLIPVDCSVDVQKMIEHVSNNSWGNVLKE